MLMPNFLIIGAAKSGTSALYHYLRQHPEIYMSPVKEPHFFDFYNQDPNTRGPGDTIPKAITNLQEYQALFTNATNQKAIGEASPTYLYFPRACDCIYEHIPDAKLISILRNPVERAFSAYMHVIRDGRESEMNFMSALEKESERIQAYWGPIWHYKQGGFYFQQLKKYYDTFPYEQIRIYLHQDFTANPLQTLEDIFDFLDVDRTFTPDVSTKPNVSGTPKSRTLQRLLHALFVQSNPVKSISRIIVPEQTRWRITTRIRNWNLIKTRISPEARQYLTTMFREDVLQLQELIKRDLSDWLE